ncbi:MAG: thiopurine S-methyltransferase [Burkholderiales bacterium]|nr:thiopurine S-methyltransferase [Burkholderiales bacterium]
MEADFWHQKWERGDIGFHESAVNALLIKHFEKLNLAKGSRIFLPLCGKTRDIAWLLACGYSVVGAELSERAVKDLFEELGLQPEIEKLGASVRYRAKDIDVIAGDIFALSVEILGPVNAIYDRAALVALPAPLRGQYAAHLINISAAAPQLLICIEYEQRQMDGPPFSVNAAEVEQHYGATYRLKSVESKPIVGGLKGRLAATENAWLLEKFHR